MNHHRATMNCRVSLVLLLLAALVPAAGLAGEPLTLGIHPFLRPSELMERFTPLAGHLGSLLDRPVHIEIARDYAAHIQAIGEDRVDIAYLGPAPYVRMVKEYGPKPILAQLEDRGVDSFRGVIIARADSGLESLADLAGKRFAFGDPDSTMSHLVPRALLLQAGIGAGRLRGFEHLPNHMAVALGVLGGLFDAGAVKGDIFRRYEARGLKALAFSPPVAEHLFVARATLPKETIGALRAALLRLPREGRGPVILHALKPSLTGLRPGDDRDYDALRGLLETLAQAGAAP